MPRGRLSGNVTVKVSSSALVLMSAEETVVPPEVNEALWTSISALFILTELTASLTCN